MMNVCLIGYMGSGKTTAGKKLAKLLNLEFVDLDADIEELAEKSIPDIFRTVGVDGFRVLERQALISALGRSNALISTGGGAPCFFNNMELINASSTSVYLKMKVSALVNRLMNAVQERPIIAGKSEQELATFITDHLQERNPFYSQAHLTFDAHQSDRKLLEAWSDTIRAHVLS
jgi:shikimate kinase